MQPNPVSGNAEATDHLLVNCSPFPGPGPNQQPHNSDPTSHTRKEMHCSTGWSEEVQPFLLFPIWVKMWIPFGKSMQVEILNDLQWCLLPLWVLCECGIMTLKVRLTSVTSPGLMIMPHPVFTLFWTLDKCLLVPVVSRPTGALKVFLWLYSLMAVNSVHILVAIRRDSPHPPRSHQLHNTNWGQGSSIFGYSHSWRDGENGP